MLTKCPECELQVSDKAFSCPHCGYPMKPELIRKYKKPTKRKRLPNGFGQISEIKNQNLRKPFRAMVSVGKNETGRPIVKPLKPVSYFETYNDAYAALLEYNRNPYDLDSSITMKELYEEWSSKYFKNISKGISNKVKQAWQYCSSIYNIRVIDIRIKHLKGCLENGYILKNDEKIYPNSYVKSRMKTNFNLMFDYAVENEIVEQNKARQFTLEQDIVKDTKITKKDHIIFTDDEIETLWKHVDDCEGVDIILIQCYSGWRPQELETLLVDDIDLENGIMRGGLKTEAGYNRIVPIHPRIKPLIERQYQISKEIGCKQLITCNMKYKKNVPLMYSRYMTLLNDNISKLNLQSEHRPHDGRKHFITTAKKYKMDEYAIKYIVGHSIDDLTERVYTDRDIEWLKEEMKKIK